MKSITKLILSISIAFLFSSCATIVGGNKYYAHVTVEGHPDATILTKRIPQGKGSATFSVKRKDANKFSVSVKEDGCEEQQFNYKRRVFRGWAFAGSLAFWTSSVDGIPVPIGVAVDLINGSYWKPDIREKGVSKTNYKHFNYTIYYTGCKERDVKKAIIPEINPATENQQQLVDKAKAKADRLREMKKLLDEGILTQEEYEREKGKILEEK